MPLYLHMMSLIAHTTAGHNMTNECSLSATTTQYIHVEIYIEQCCCHTLYYIISHKFNTLEIT